MGFDLNRCIDCYIDDKFLCQICCGVIEGPKMIANCGHIFCEQCLLSWVEDKHNCPIDQNSVDSQGLTDVHNNYSEKYANILLKCENANLGCLQLFSIIDDGNHHDNCKYNKSNFHQCDCGDFVNNSVSNHNCVDYLKNEIQSLKSNQIKLHSINSELQLKLSKKVEECLQMKKYVSNVKHYETTPQLRDLVEALKELRIICSLGVEQTLLSVDRQLFCPQDPYNNHKTDIGFGAEFNSPVIDSIVLELLRSHLIEGCSVLDIGCGTGYTTVCMAIMCGKYGTVVGIDHIPQLIESARNNVKMNFPDLPSVGSLEFVVNDGRLGLSEMGPYDVINVGVCVQQFPEFLVNQLKCGGRMTVAIGDASGLQGLETIDKTSNGSTVRTTHIKLSLKPLTSIDIQLKGLLI